MKCPNCYRKDPSAAHFREHPECLTAAQSIAGMVAVLKRKNNKAGPGRPRKAASVSTAENLPEKVIARWGAEDWADDRMTAIRYRYETIDGELVELSEKDIVERYAWGQVEDNTAGGSQTGVLLTSLVAADPMR